MKVFLTGGSGFVGREVLRRLRGAGHSVRVLMRSKRAGFENTDAGIEVFAGNVLDARSLAGALDGIDAVIHLVGVISELRENTFKNVHAGGTQNIVAAAKNAGVRRFIHMSALGTRPNAVSRYHQSKWAAEEIVRGSGLAWTIFRPSIIYGPDDGFVNLFARMARSSPIIPIMGGGQSKMQPVPVGDVAACFVGALNEDRAIGQTFDLCGPEALSFDEIVDAIMAVTHRRRWKLHIPFGIARIQAAAMEILFPKLLGKASPLNRDQLLMLAEDNVGNPLPAAELFGLQSVPFRQGIASYLR